MLISRWSPFTLGLTHLITLRFVDGNVGAMLQMRRLSPVRRYPYGIGRQVDHGLLLMGTILLKISFVTESKPATLLAPHHFGAGF